METAVPSVVVLARVLRPFQQFARSQSFGAAILLAAAGLALVWANSPWRDAYFGIWNVPVSLGPASHPLTLSVLHWINDGLMAVFFLVVGLELKRELLVGELASPGHALLPIAAAIGGMALPALLYAGLNAGGGPAAAGWGIPMATDIAFALGVSRLLGSSLPPALTVFLAALAIVDDLGAVVVIALFYTHDLSPAHLGWAAGALVALFVLNRLGVRRLAPYLVVGVGLWYALHGSGVHATIAGVLLAMAIPVRTRIDAAEYSAQVRRLLDEFDGAETGDRRVITSRGQQEAIHAMERVSEGVQAPLLRLEHALHSLVALAVMPLFAFANAGIDLSALALDVAGRGVATGVAAGLLIGKPLGIFGASWLAVRMGWAALPTNVTWPMLHGAAWLGGIGFTMALFVGGLAFGTSPLLDAAKVGILAASAAAGIVGGALLVRATRSRGTPPA
jgi:NhaA family Na+:H+ antiporter